MVSPSNLISGFKTCVHENMARVMKADSLESIEDIDEIIPELEKKFKRKDTTYMIQCTLVGSKGLIVQLCNKFSCIRSLNPEAV